MSMHYQMAFSEAMGLRQWLQCPTPLLTTIHTRHSVPLAMAPLLYGGIQTLISRRQCQHLKLPLPSSFQHLKPPLLSCFRHRTLMGSSSGVFKIGLAKKSFKAS